MTKIKANSASLGRYRTKVDVFINGEKTLRCMDADEREGTAWIMREREGHPLAAILGTKPGDFVCQGVIVDRIVGTVEFRFTLSESDPSEEEARQEIQSHYQPIEIYQVVQ